MALLIYLFSTHMKTAFGRLLIRVFMSFRTADSRPYRGLRRRVRGFNPPNRKNCRKTMLFPNGLFLATNFIIEFSSKIFKIFSMLSNSIGFFVQTQREFIAGFINFWKKAKIMRFCNFCRKLYKISEIYPTRPAITLNPRKCICVCHWGHGLTEFNLLIAYLFPRLALFICNLLLSLSSQKKNCTLARKS